MTASQDWTTLEDRLKSLPKNPTEAYCDIVKRMCRNRLDMDFARRILGWILGAQRVLSMSELRQALAIPKDYSSSNLFDDIDNKRARAIIQTCGGLVRHSQDTDLVTFSHETARSFLESDDPKIKSFLQEHQLDPLPSHSDLCRTCLSHLRLPEFERPCAGGNELSWRWLKFEFGKYAAQFWATHAIQSERESETEIMILETFKSQGRRDSIEQLRFWYDTTGMSLLHLLIENRLAFIFMSALPSEKSIDRMCASFIIGADCKVIGTGTSKQCDKCTGWLGLHSAPLCRGKWGKWGTTSCSMVDREECRRSGKGLLWTDRFAPRGDQWPLGGGQVVGGRGTSRQRTTMEVRRWTWRSTEDTGTWSSC